MFNFFNNKHNLKNNEKPTFPYIEIPIVAGCNLKCNYCSFFCNYIDEISFIDIKEFEKDLKELSKKIKINRLRILGGEPLLHPNVSKFLIVAREVFPDSAICIVTNGILLPKMNKEFWQTTINYNIAIDISYYPIWKDNFLEIKNLLQYYKIRNYTIKDSIYFSDLLNIKGDSNIKKTYNNCVCKQWINLWQHKLYPCTNAFRVFYNKKFNTKLDIPKGYDIYKESGKKLYEKLIIKGKPSKACRFCNTSYKIHKWSKYEKNKN